MAGIAVRLSDNNDPEERLEEASLWKALHDEFGESAKLVETVEEAGGRLFVGRASVRESGANRGATGPLDYWNDPAFLRAAGREFHVCDFSEAVTRVADLHSRGKGAFVKATRAKFYIARIPVGVALPDEMGDMAFSFMDAGKCLMVQELIPIECERRFIIINREVVTSSPVAWHLTPLDHNERNRHFRTPQTTDSFRDDALLEQMTRFAEAASKELLASSVCLDCGISNGSVVAIETNPMHLGQLGLYACDVREIAKATRALAA